MQNNITSIVILDRKTSSDDIRYITMKYKDYLNNDILNRVLKYNNTKVIALCNNDEANRTLRNLIRNLIIGDICLIDNKTIDVITKIIEAYNPLLCVNHKLLRKVLNRYKNRFLIVIYFNPFLSEDFKKNIINVNNLRAP